MSLFGDNCQPGLCGCNDPDPEPRVTVPLDYAARCERYARQRGWAYDEHELSIGHLTPRQRRRALKKECHAWPGYSRRSIDMPWDPRYGPFNDGYDGAFYDDDPADPLWEVSYPGEPYCVTPGCDCCGGDDD